MTADLAADRRHGEGEEVGAALGREPVDRVDQPDRRHLHEIVQRLAAAREPAGDVLGHRQVPGDQYVAHRLPTGVVGGERGVLGQQRDEVAVLGVGRGHRGGAPACLSSRMPTVGAAVISAVGAVLPEGLDVVGEGLQHPPAERVRGHRRVRRSPRARARAPRCARRARGTCIAACVAGAATSTSVAQASSTAIRRSEIASRSKSARAARSDATARIVGISAAVAEVRTSTTECSPSVSAGRWESQSDTLSLSSRSL